MAPVNAPRPRVSYADLERWPDDGRRYELYDGEVVVVPSPLPLHQIVADAICQVFRAFARATGGLAITSPIDIIFTEFDVVQPDIVFFTRATRVRISLTAPIRVAPDIAVEVLSPSTEQMDRGRKMRAFARFGVAEYWIVDPRAETIEIYVLVGGDYELRATFRRNDDIRAATIEGLTFPAESIFGDL